MDKNVDLLTCLSILGTTRNWMVPNLGSNENENTWILAFHCFHCFLIAVWHCIIMMEKSSFQVRFCGCMTWMLVLIVLVGINSVSQKMVNVTFFTEGIVLNFLMLVEPRWWYSLDCLVFSGSWWWTQKSSPVAVFMRNCPLRDVIGWEVLEKPFSRVPLRGL